MTVTPAAKNVFEHNLNTQEYAKLDSNRKKLKRALRVRFNDRLDLESDIAVRSFRASCVSFSFIFCHKPNPRLEKNGHDYSKMFRRRIWMSYKMWAPCYGHTPSSLV